VNATIRPGLPDDADMIADAHVRAWQVAYRGIVQDSFLDSPAFALARRDGWRRTLSGDLPDGWDVDHRVLVPVVDDCVVGFGHIGRERIDVDDDPNGFTLGDEGELYSFYLHPDAWGSGIAPALIDACHGALRKRFSTACLWVLRENPRARRFYEREGWSATDVNDVKFWDGPQIPDVPPLAAPLAELRYQRSLE
jgi:GNAT superfamily N-acetyltransferase